MIRRYALFPLLVLASVAHARTMPLDNLSAARQSKRDTLTTNIGSRL